MKGKPIVKFKTHANFSLLLIVLLMCCLSCHQANNKNHLNKLTTSLKKTNGKKSKYRPEIIGVLDLAKDTFVVITYTGLMMTTNGGKSWKDISQDHFSYDLAIDDNNVLWINRCWGGIHEPSVSKFYRSADWGVHWETIEWDPEKFLPLHIISPPRTVLTIVTKDYKIYRLNGKNPKTDWVYVRTATEKEFNNSTNVPPYYTASYNGIKLYKMINGKVDTLVHFTDLSDLSNLLKVKDTLYLAGNRLDTSPVSHAYFVEVIKEKKIRYFDVPGTYVYAKKGFHDRIWVYNNDNLYLKGKTKLVKIY